MVDVRTLESRNLVSRSVDSLRKLILNDLNQPSSKLPSQGELCARLGVSRTVVREATRILQSQGWIDISQGKVPTVRPVTPHAVITGLSTLVERSSVSLIDVWEARRPIEIEAAVLAAGRATEEHLEQMREANEALAKARTIEEQIVADMRFHKFIADASGNPVFGILLDVLAQFLFESRRTTLKQSGAKVALHHHRKLYEAIAERDAIRARKAAEDGMEQTRADLRREMAQSKRSTKNSGSR